MAVETRWENVDTLLQRAERTKSEGLVKAIQEIAAARYGFPTPELPAYRTFVNAPDVTMQVQVGEREVVPDIVVVEKIKTGETHLVITAAVADREMVNEAEAAEHWAPCASVPNSVFYLYVPVGYGVAAKKLCRAAKIRPEGVRTWRWTPRGFEVNDVSEPMSGLAPLIPPFARRFLVAH